MATFDSVVNKLPNFKGYTGNPPTTKAEYVALDCWTDIASAPSWDSVSSDMAAEEVRVNRENEYPSITNVVVALAEKAEGRSAMWDEITAQRLDVKSKYPKP